MARHPTSKIMDLPRTAITLPYFFCVLIHTVSMLSITVAKLQETINTHSRQQFSVNPLSHLRTRSLLGSSLSVGGCSINMCGFCGVVSSLSL